MSASTIVYDTQNSWIAQLDPQIPARSMDSCAKYGFIIHRLRSAIHAMDRADPCHAAMDRADPCHGMDRADPHIGPNTYTVHRQLVPPVPGSLRLHSDWVIILAEPGPDLSRGQQPRTATDWLSRLSSRVFSWAWVTPWLLSLRLSGWGAKCQNSHDIYTTYREHHETWGHV